MVTQPLPWADCSPVLDKPFGDENADYYFIARKLRHDTHTKNNLR